MSTLRASQMAMPALTLVRFALAAAFLISAAGAASAEEAVRCEEVESIGIATMSPDGVITLRIRSLPPGPIAEGAFQYPPAHPRYQAILKHIGGIAPGETKPVRPWC